MDIQKQKLTIEGAVTYSRLFDALKGMYEVDDDDSVWEIFNQADDQLEEVVNALKLLSAPPAPVVVKRPGTECIGWVRDAIREHDAKWIAAVEAAGGSVADE